jgi:glutamyl-tRNA synthetase
VLEDAAGWWRIVSGQTQPVIEDRELTDKAAALLPDVPWDDTTWDVWISALKTASGRKGRALFHPLRLALTGREDGPELKLLLPLIGRERSEARLLGRAA